MIENFLRVEYRLIDVIDRRCRDFSMAWVKSLQTEAAQARQGIEIVTDAAGFRNIRKRAAGEDTVGGEQQIAGGLNDRNTPGSMPRCVKNS